MIIITTVFISIAVTCCYQCKDSIMSAVYFPASFSMRIALGQMRVLTPVSGHPALNVFLWKIKGCMNRPVEQRDMRSVHLIIHYHYFMGREWLNHKELIKKITCLSEGLQSLVLSICDTSISSSVGFCFLHARWNLYNELILNKTDISTVWSHWVDSGEAIISQGLLSKGDNCSYCQWRKSSRVCMLHC